MEHQQLPQLHHHKVTQNHRGRELDLEDTEPWNLPPSKDDYILTICNCEPFILDEVGFRLLKRYRGHSIGGGWHYNSRIEHLYRREYYWLDGRGIKGIHERIVLFHHELLGFPNKGEVAVFFVNGNSHDYRRVNFLFWPYVTPRITDNS